jgi:predicted nucleic acid-binding protein
MTLKPFKDWEHVFLDTTVIVNLLLSLKTGVTDPIAIFTNKLISYLNSSNSGAAKKRHFYVSSVSVSELLRKSPNGRAVEIINAINSENVTFVAFDNDIAELMINSYHPFLAKDTLNAFARQLSWPEHDLVLAREWIQRDMMILASSHYVQADAILTSDSRTMYRTAKELSVPCALSFPQYFQQSDQHIMAYDHATAFAEN